MPIDRRRRATTGEGAASDLELEATLRLQRDAVEASEVPLRSKLPDRRRPLLSQCAHPAIDARMRTPLMLRPVLGLKTRWTHRG